MTYLLLEMTAFLLIAFALGVALGWAIWAQLYGAETALDRAWRWILVRLGFATDTDLDRAERAEIADAARFAQIEARFAETDAAARERIAELSAQVVALSRGDRVVELEAKLAEAEARSLDADAAASRVADLESDLAATGAIVAERDDAVRRAADLEAENARLSASDRQAEASRIAALESALEQARAAEESALAARAEAVAQSEAAERRATEAEHGVIDAERRIAALEAAAVSSQDAPQDGSAHDDSGHEAAAAAEHVDEVAAARVDAMARELEAARSRIAELEASAPARRDARGRIEVLRASVGVAEASQPALLDAPRGDVADDLKLIKGVGPKLESVLHGLGVYHFDQIAAWTEAEVAWVDDHLRFRGRIGRDGWIAQARVLASGAQTEFSARSA